MADEAARVRWVRRWDRQASSYDRGMGVADKYWFGDTRRWVCSRAWGRALEVAVGTGLNLDHYPTDVAVTGIDTSDGMLERARDRARQLDRAVQLQLGDAESLPFADASFDSVVCTFSLCAIPDPSRAMQEMTRVLRPGGHMLLADHVASSSAALRGAQKLVELVSVPLAGEHYRRRPSRLIDPVMRIETRERFKLGTVERLVARRSG